MNTPLATEDAMPDSVQRLVRRLMPVRRKRCGVCAHLKSEHIKDSLCWDGGYWETVMLPVCIECGKRVCADEEDELCQVCWKSGLPPNPTGGVE